MPCALGDKLIQPEEIEYKVKPIEAAVTGSAIPHGRLSVAA
jgi:hypothetical protein